MNKKVNVTILTPKNLPRYGDDQKTRTETALYNPAVLMNSTTLYLVDYKRIELPLGTIVKVISETNDWFYIQTTYGQEGYVSRKTCLPFKIPPSQETNIKFRKQNIHNLFKTWKNFYSKKDVNLSETNVDILYLKAIGLEKGERQQNSQKLRAKHSSEPITLIIRNDYICESEYTLTVKRGDVVLLLHNHVKGWFWVRNLWAEEGFIPTAVAAYRFD